MARGKWENWSGDDGLVRIAGWARDGLIDKQIAHNMGISYSTFREWKKRYPTLAAALKEAKDVVDREVENALLKRALGYKYTEKRVEKEGGVVVKEITTVKEVAPDVTARIFWLKNRKPKDWRDKVVVADDSDIAKLDELIGSIDRLAGAGR